ncbi:phosphotransferase [Jatrophihabitans endophyticus]|uniref:phosphotransferase n=1 Tax=Jatrophihabitans endophyticus TaxID=1206085 RepID=UPI0019DF4185|nr:phosphotransferase [Jatrophihabitans endophyticus]MBE7186877.1 phosphotransferase [Jatrophihabitans endophyticus]
MRAVARDVVGEEPLTVERQVYGHGSATFAVRTAEGVVYVRTSPDPATYRATAANLRGLASLGLPVPRLLALDLSLRRHPFAYLVTDAFAGRDLGLEIGSMSPYQASSVAASVVEAQRRVGRLARGTGFGFGPLGAGGPHPDWAAAIRADRPELEDNASLAARTLATFESVRPRLHDVQATCFLDDVTT